MMKIKMNRLFLFQMFESNCCKFVFVISLVIVYLLVPKKIFYGYYTILGGLFIISTSLVISCFVRNIRERVFSASKNGASFVGILMSIFGLSALQICTIGAPVCGVSIGAGLLSMIFPAMAFNFLEEYGIYVVILSLVAQIFALYFMKCFNKIIEIKK